MKPSVPQGNNFAAELDKPNYDMTQQCFDDAFRYLKLAKLYYQRLPAIALFA